MAELRTSWLSQEAQLHWDEKQTLFGQVIPGRTAQGERNIGAWGSLKQSFVVDGLGYARDQWRTLVDQVNDVDQEQLTPERYDELVNDPVMGKLDVPFEPGLTVRQFRNRVRRHKRDMYMQTYERSLGANVTRIGGAMAGGILAPEILSTIWVGGPLAQAAIRAPTTAQGMRLAMGSATQISAVATPLNIVAQRATYGQVDPLETALTATTPFLFTPAVVGFGRAISPKAQQRTADANKTRLPSPTEEPPDTYVPQSFREEFEAYPGGVERWVDDIARNNESAIAYGRTVGLTDEALAEVKLRTFTESSQTPIGREDFLDLDALEAFASSDFVSPSQLTRLERAGLQDLAESARVAERTPPFAQTPEQRLALRSVEERRAAVIQRFPELADALRYRDFVRAGGGAPEFGIPGGRAQRVGPATKPVVNSTLRNQATEIRDAVRNRDASALPEEFRDIAQSLIRAADVDRATRRVAFREESNLLDTINRLADGDATAQQTFVQRVLRQLPEHAEGDWRAFQNTGIEGVRARFIERQFQRADDLSARLGLIEEARAGRRGRPTKEQQQARNELREQLRLVESLLEDAQQRVTRPPAQISVDDLADILSASRFKRAEPGMNETGVRARDKGQAREAQDNARAPEVVNENVTEADLDEIVRFARDNGVDPDTVSNEYSAAIRAITECRL